MTPIFELLFETKNRVYMPGSLTKNLGHNLLLN